MWFVHFSVRQCLCYFAYFVLVIGCGGVQLKHLPFTEHCSAIVTNLVKPSIHDFSLSEWQDLNAVTLR